MALTDKLTAIADAIRSKTGGTDKLTLDQMPTEIAGLETGGGSGGEELARSIIDRSVSGEFTDNELIFVGRHAFSYCGNLTKISLPNVLLTSNYAFSDCSKLQEVHLPELKNDVAAANENSNYAFANCSALTKVYIPKVVKVSMYMFRNCVALEELDLPCATNIISQAFGGCTALAKVILRSNTVVSLANVAAFASTPFAAGGTGGTVYVPEALIESYQTATNWSTLYAAGTCNFVAIEGSEYE